MNLDLVPYVPSSKVTPPWDEALKQLDSRIFALRNPSDSEQFLADVSTLLFRISLHWLYRKKWNSKHKVPGSRNVVREIEPFADLLVALLELAKEVHFRQTTYAKEYSDAGKWFQLAAPALRLLCFGERSSKSNLVSDLRHEKNAMMDGINPFCSEGAWVHLWRMVEDSITEADVSDEFRRKYWRGLRNPGKGGLRGFLDCYGAWANELQSNTFWGVASVDGGKVSAQVGRGKWQPELFPKMTDRNP
jgi:hypothetical protein